MKPGSEQRARLDERGHEVALRQSLHEFQAEENAGNAASNKTFMQDRTTEWPTGRPKDPEILTIPLNLA